MGGQGSGRRPTAVCGTKSGYKRHRRNSEPPCQPCKDANAAYYRERRPNKSSTRRPNKTRPDGTSKNWHKQQREAAYRKVVNEWKLQAGQCLDCGFVITNETLVCIDCDHRDPQAKAFTISYEVGRRDIQELIAELEKCDPVCRNCHALRTAKNKHHLTRRTNQPVTHYQLGLFDE